MEWNVKRWITEQVSHDELRQMCENVIHLLVTTQTSMDNIFWPRLLHYTLNTEYSRAFGVIAKALAHISKTPNFASDIDSGAFIIFHCSLKRSNLMEISSNQTNQTHSISFSQKNGYDAVCFLIIISQSCSVMNRMNWRDFVFNYEVWISIRGFNLIVGDMPSSEAIVARFLVLARSPVPLEKCTAVLQFLQNYSVFVGPQLNQLWTKEIPPLLETAKVITPDWATPNIHFSER